MELPSLSDYSGISDRFGPSLHYVRACKRARPTDQPPGDRLQPPRGSEHALAHQLGRPHVRSASPVSLAVNLCATGSRPAWQLSSSHARYSHHHRTILVNDDCVLA